MKSITLTILAAFLIAFLPACKKTDNLTPQQKLLGKWHLQTILTHDHIAGADHTSTYTGTANDYVDFRSDGKVYSNVQGQPDTSFYALTGDTKLEIFSTNYSDSYDVKTLTSSTFVVYVKTSYNNNYSEETSTFNK